MSQFDFLATYRLSVELMLQLTEPNTTNTDNFTLCKPPINHQQFYLWLLVPGVLLSVLLAFTQTRKSKYKHCLNGRPGLLIPQDAFTRSNRVSYAAAFGAIASLCSKVIFESRYAIDYNGLPYFTVFVALLSMFLYGVGYFPLFAALAVNSVFGYAVGTLYAWMLTCVTMYGTFYCPSLKPEEYGLIICRSFPEILCYLYLCISLPVRFVLSVRRKQFFGFMVDYAEGEDMFAAIRKSYQGIHVHGLLIPPKPIKEPDTKLEKIKNLVKGLIEKLIYKRIHCFRYSSRILSIAVVSVCLLYSAVVELMISIVPLFQFVELIISLVWRMADNGQLADAAAIFGLTDFVYYIETFQIGISFVLDLLTYIVFVSKISFIVSLSAAFVLGVLMILHSLSSYRNNLLELYKGNSCHLTPQNEKSSGSLLVGCMRYAGYQVAYVAWGFFVQFMIFFLICFAVSGITIMVKYGLGPWLLNKFHNIWPVLITSLVINFIQLGLSYFFFLQKNSRGEFVLRVENRRSFFIFVYFMFFYNIFVGLISCLLRILKAILLGALFLPRLDHSTLPRKFQWFDPGFDAYCGYMHTESAHSHPVVMVFISILQAARLLKLEREKQRGLSEIATTDGDIPFKNINKDEDRDKKSYRARFKWHLAYTLVNNPSLLLMRKAEIYRQQLLNSEMPPEETKMSLKL